MREALTIEVDGVQLQGTRHAGSRPGERGVLFLNFGYQPRSARGDLAAHLADELAGAGFVCYRFDLPGLGDSQGEVPAEVLAFYQFIQEGGYAECAARLAALIFAEDRLQDLALLGLCGGAITSVFAAPKLRSLRISGLVLLDPQFFLYESADSARTGSRSGKEAASRLKKSYAAVHDWLLESRLEPYLSYVYGGVKRALVRLRKNRLPKNANLPLLTTLFDSLEHQLPMLAITAHPPSPLPPGFDYLEYIQQRSGSALRRVKIADTTHSFVENGGRAAVLAEVSQWLASLRPASTPSPAAGSSLRAPSSVEPRSMAGVAAS